jgi:hypothetical protein
MWTFASELGLNRPAATVENHALVQHDPFEQLLPCLDVGDQLLELGALDEREDVRERVVRQALRLEPLPAAGIRVGGVRSIHGARARQSVTVCCAAQITTPVSLTTTRSRLRAHARAASGSWSARLPSHAVTCGPSPRAGAPSFISVLSPIGKPLARR